MSGLMRGGWKRGLVSGPQRLRSSAWTAPDHQGHRASLLLYPSCRSAFVPGTRLLYNPYGIPKGSYR